MAHTDQERIGTCWHCGAPQHVVQRFCSTCGATPSARAMGLKPLTPANLAGVRGIVNGRPETGPAGREERAPAAPQARSREPALSGR